MLIKKFKKMIKQLAKIKSCSSQFLAGKICNLHEFPISVYSAFIPLHPSNRDMLLLSLVCTFFLSYLTKQGTGISFLKIHWRNVYGTLSSINNKRLTMLLHSTEHFSLVIFHYFGLLLQTGNGKASLTNRTGNSSNTNYAI